MRRENTSVVRARQTVMPEGAATFYDIPTSNLNSRKKKKGLGVVAGIALATCFAFSNASLAQRVACAGAVTQVNAGAFTATLQDDLVVNADMLTHDLGNGYTIKAIAYGRRYTATPVGTGLADAYVYAEDWNGNNLTFQLTWPNAQRPDIVLASDDDQHNQGGMNVSYKAIISYISDSTLHYDIWRLDDCGLPSFNATHLFTSNTLNDSAGGSFMDPYHNDPHIDMWSDASGSVDPANGLPLMWDFAIVWSEGTRHWPSCSQPTPNPPWPLWPITAETMRYIVSSANNTSTTPTPITFSAHGYNPDVACLTDISGSGGGSGKFMEVAYAGDACLGGLFQFEWDPWIGLPAMVGFPNNPTGDAIFSPRIEAMSQYGGSGSGVKWQIVTAQDNGLMVPRWQIWGYNDLPTVAWISDMYTLASDSDCKAPCVAAGISPSFSSDIGNQQYTPGFYPRTKDTIHDRLVDVNTGALNTRWWNVNCPANPVNYHWDAARSMAVTNSSNSGFNLLTAWYDGSNIQYKESPNTMLFKHPTSVGTASKRGKLRVYPNPANNELHIDGASTDATYRIADMSGRLLQKGAVPINGAVNVQYLVPGMYMFSVADENKGTQTTRFTK